MQTIIKQLRELGIEELLAISEAIDLELGSRLERGEEIPDSARRRAVMREQSYRKSTGSSAPPVRATGLKERRKRRDAA